MATLASRIRALRHERGLTGSQLGKICGVEKSTISLYEHGKSVPNDQIKTVMCRYFGVSMDYLLGLTDDRTPPDADALPADPQIQEAIEYLSGLSDEAKASALRYLQAIKTLDEVKGDSGKTIIFEKKNA